MRFALVPALALVLAACGGNHAQPAAPVPSAAPTAAPSASAAKGVVPAGEAKVGDKSLCPVSKDEFVITDSSPKVEYEGKTYYFCCAGCDEKFKADPKKYLQH
ncbi:MAG: YHS domain-containing protein [Polyangiales bacterium]